MDQGSEIMLPHQLKSVQPPVCWTGSYTQLTPYENTHEQQSEL